MGAKLTRGEDVMVSFMCQRDGTTGSPGIWLNIILDMSVMAFLDEINI